MKLDTLIGVAVESDAGSGQDPVISPMRRLGPLGPFFAVALAALGFGLIGNFASQMVSADPLVDRFLACEPELLLNVDAEGADVDAVDECVQASRAAFEAEGVDYVTRSVHERARLFFNAVGIAALVLAWLTPFVGRRHKLTRWSIAATSVLTLLTLMALVAQLWYGDTIAVLTKIYYS